MKRFMKSITAVEDHVSNEKDERDKMVAELQAEIGGKYMDGSAVTANKRGGIVKFGKGESYQILNDGEHAVSVSFPTAINMVDLNSGKLHSAFSIHIHIFPDANNLDEIFASAKKYGARFTAEEAQDVLDHLIGKSYEDIVSWLSSR